METNEGTTQKLTHTSMAEQIKNISNPSPEDLRLDYQQTCEQFRLLADIRFKLLAFVPILAGKDRELMLEISSAIARLDEAKLNYQKQQYEHSLKVTDYQTRNAETANSNHIATISTG